MGSKPFSNADPFLQIIILFLLSFVGVAVFMMMASGIINALWGISMFSDPTALQDYSNPQLVNINRLLLIFQHLGMFVLPGIAFAFLMTSKVKNFLGLKRVSKVQLIAAIGVMLCALPAINAMSYLNELIAFPSFLSGIEEVFMEMETNAAALTHALTGGSSGWIYVFNLAVIAILPAVGEEMIFRGLLLPILAKWTGKVHLAVWISAILFSAMHMQFYGFIPRMVLGAILGYLYVWSGSLWTPIVAHFTNNAVALTMLFFMARGVISDEVDTFEPGAVDMIWLVVSVAGLLALLFFIRRKGNAACTKKSIVEDSVAET